MTTVENGAGDAASKDKTVEDKYQKTTPLEHVLLRPDIYIDSVEPTTELMWIYDKEKQMMIQREVTYVPGLFKIFDEILVNAADNKQRDPKMDMIKIEIDEKNNQISVWNNGEGIPVVVHKKENMYVPTMIFGHLLTSSNYDDTQARVTGGRNGLGAKLCNIFSHRFTVETASKKYKKRLKQTWGNNMRQASEPVISDFKGEDFTRVTFSPDLKKFHMQSLDQDIVDLMSRRALDVAASTRGVKVVLNGEKLPIKNFKDYVNLYVKGKEDDVENPLNVVYENCGPRWEVAVTLSTKGFQHVSFVNSIATTKGGRHIDHVADLITKQLMEILKKKNKTGIQMKPAQIKNHLWIFVNCLIDNPSFNTQTKEHMTLQQKNFGSKCVLSEKFITSITKAGFVEAILTWANRKADDQLQKLGSKSKRRKLHIDKLEDANDAGTAKSVDCTLILTEGDSAKTMAVSGISNIGRDKYGIFPLRGKILNVRDATPKQILENAEINKLLNIIGLRYGKKYETREDLKTLRYGKMMIMTDQDQDGSHIKGLLINFIHHNWPSLLKLDFIEEFITPIVKATKGSQQLSFFSLPEFEMWKKETSNFHTYKIKYYKGLGTSTAKEAKEYFDNMARHRIRFKYEGGQDDQNIKMAFSKHCVSQRKDWLTNHMEETKRRKEIGLGEKYLYEKNTRTVTFSDFVNAELVLFSNYDNVRSIPNMIDGFKPGQRKVLYTCMKRNDKHEVKVAQLAGSVAEHSAYHHGEQSLMATIINLAQNFVGSNNINLLQPIGQFGSRLMGGKDSASPRYIFTMLSPLTRIIFNKFDDALLAYEFDDNRKIEPVFYVPIIPMILVNGAEGIGTGWSTKILNYNPREIIENLCRMMDGEDPHPMIPYYKNFKGDVESFGDYQYVFSGEISVIGADKVEITELPVGRWTQVYKDTVLEPMLHGTEKQPPIITDYKEYNTDTEVRFLIFINRDKLVELEKDGLHKVFKLQTPVTCNSKCAFDENLCLRKFDSVLEILRGFYKVRLEFYLKRKNYMEGYLDAEMKKLSNQARFISEICEGSLVVHDKKKKGLIAELVKRKYDSDPLIAWKMRQNREEVLQEVAENLSEEAESATVENFEYLYGMNILTLTEDRRDELLRQRDDKIAELKRLQSRTPISLWKEDLDTLLAELNKVEEKERKEEQKSKQTSKKPPQKLYKTDDKRRVLPVIDMEMKKKAEKYDKEKKEGTKKQAKQVKKEPVDEKDEFDALVESNVKPLDDRIGNSPDKIEKKAATKKGMKQTTLPFKTSKKEKKKHQDSEDSEDDIDFDSISPVTPRTPRRAAAAAKKNYNLSSNESESDTGHIELDSDVEVSKPKTTKRVIAVDSDSDDAFKIDKKAPPPKVSSEELFDSLIGSSTTPKETNKSLEVPSSEDSPVKPPPKKVIARKKPENGGAKGPKKGVKKPRKKRSKVSDSDSDEVFSAKGSNAKRHKKDSDTSNDIDSDDVVDATPPPRATAGRARKPVSYAIKSDDESD